MALAMLGSVMGTTALDRQNQRNGRLDATARARAEHVKIVLVEWAAYPLYRNKIVDTHTVRCGLGRMLDGLKRYDPVLPIDVVVVINGAEEQGATDPKSLQWPTGLRGKVEHLLRRERELRLARRMRSYATLPRKYPFVEAVHFRGNQGQDFGAYDFGYQLLRREGHTGDVLFMNSSVSGPHEDGWLLKYRDQFRRHPNVGLCGIGLNSHDTTDGDGPFAPHVQSYFLYTNMQVLEHAIGPRLFEEGGHGAIVSGVPVANRASPMRANARASSMSAGNAGTLTITSGPGGASRVNSPAMSVAAKTKIFIRATSLGGVESLIEHRASIEGPGTTSPAGLLRASIGLENADDLIEDLDQALG